MTLRTYKQLGQAYGSSPVTLVAKINGEEVFNGTLHTLDQSLPSLPITGISFAGFGGPIFSWTTDIAFMGSASMELTVTGGTLLLTNTFANYITTPTYGSIKPGDEGYMPDAPLPSDPPTPFKDTLYGAYTDPTYIDPLTSVTINGQEQTDVYNSHPDLKGQWYWALQDGSVFTATVLQSPGVE